MICTTKYGTETRSYLSPKLWNLVSNKYKTIESLAGLNAKKSLWPRESSVQVIENIIHQIGLI